MNVLWNLRYYENSLTLFIYIQKECLRDEPIYRTTIQKCFPLSPLSPWIQFFFSYIFYRHSKVCLTIPFCLCVTTGQNNCKQVKKVGMSIHLNRKRTFSKKKNFKLLKQIVLHRLLQYVFVYKAEGAGGGGGGIGEINCNFF